jgi:glycosyltransferase involved in cell wall biosynthesis
VPLYELGEDGKLAVGDPSVAIVLGPVGKQDALARCFRSLMQHTPLDTPIAVFGDGSEDPAARRWLLELEQSGTLKHDVHLFAASQPTAAAQAWNLVSAATTPADIVLLHPDCVVAEGWLDGLRDAVHSLGNAASATALSNHAAFASVPRRNVPWVLLPPDLTVDEAASRVRDASLRLRPRLPTALNHCVWITRAALDLASTFDASLESAEDAVIDWSLECMGHGLQHVLADDVLVMHRGGAAREQQREPGRVGGDPALAARRPGFDAFALEAIEDRFSALARSLAAASRALTGLSVTVDGRCLTPGLDGTRIHTLELIGALVRSGGARVRVVVPDDLGEEARRALGRLDEIAITTADQVEDGVGRSDIVHRPWQLSDAQDLAFLDLLGERIVITNQDLIAYRTPDAFPSADEWLRYRRVTAEAMAVASAVLFFTQDAADDALADDLVERDRALVVPIGVDHQLLAAIERPVPPKHRAQLEATPFLLCLGSRFRHKNLVFALRLLERLRDDHGWDGRLVLAGAEIVNGSSSGDEAAFLAAHDHLGEHVIDLAAVSEAEKQWLLQHAAAVLYPSTYEGLGLIPFEAARAGTPCLFAHVSALRDTLPEEAATLVPWDAARSAQRAIGVLRDGERADRLVKLVREASEGLTWDAAAERLLAAYAVAAESPAPAMARVATRVAQVEHEYWIQRQALSETAMTLVGHHDGLLDDEIQAALAQVASRKRLGASLRAALKVAARLPPRP